MRTHTKHPHTIPIYITLYGINPEVSPQQHDIPTTTEHMGYAVAQLVKEVRYRPGGRGFYSRWCYWLFHFPASTQPLTEISTWNISWGVMTAGA